VPALRREALRQRPRAAAASGLGSPGDQSARDGVSAASADVPVLWRNKLCGLAPGRAAGPVGTAFDGFRRVVDGLLSPEQTAHGRLPRHVARPAVLPGADRENPKPSDGGRAAVVSGVGGRTANARAPEYRRNGNQGRKRQGVAVDVRGPSLHGVRGPRHPRGYGARRFPDREVPGRRDLRSGEDVLAGGQTAMVLGAPEAGFSSDDRHA